MVHALIILKTRLNVNRINTGIAAISRFFIGLKTYGEIMNNKSSIKNPLTAGGLVTYIRA